MIVPEKYTTDKKAYLTYSAHPTAIARLLKYDETIKFDVVVDGNVICRINNMNKKFITSLENDGIKIKPVKTEHYSGVNVFELPNGRKIPVTVRQVSTNGKLENIRVRITGKTHEELIDRTYAIRDTLAAYGLKHKLCVWDRSGTI